MPFDINAFNEINKTICSLADKRLAAAGAPRIVAVTKQQMAQDVIAAITAGIGHFGENKVQEAAQKWPSIKKQHPEVVLQMIGSLQSNKAEDAVALFDEILTIDRESLADAVKKAVHKLGKRPNVMIQVNIGEEPQKGGVMPQQADALIDYCIKELELPVVGLMCVPPVGQYPAPYFALLAAIAKRHGLKRLSMGMSNDYEIATQMGATEVRLGTVLFGERG